VPGDAGLAIVAVLTYSSPRTLIWRPAFPQSLLFALDLGVGDRHIGCLSQVGVNEASLPG
jgi:hypothetical protein